jgi:hypothetical protein
MTVHGAAPASRAQPLGRHPGTPRSHRHCLRLKRAVSTRRSVRLTSQFGHDLFGEKVAWWPLRFDARRRYDLQRDDFGQALRTAGTL